MLSNQAITNYDTIVDYEETNERMMFSKIFLLPVISNIKVTSSQ